MSNQNILSVFVDESGNFGDPDDPARYCIVTLVFHDQTADISQYVKELNRSNYDLGLDSDSFRFHMGPLIRQEDEYAAMSRPMRGKILDRMMTFVRKVDFKYHCIGVDTKFINTTQQVFDRLMGQLADFIKEHRELFECIDKVKIYYDAGQKQVSRLLEEVFTENLPSPLEFAQGVRQDSYKLLQVADLICTVRLIEVRLQDGGELTKSENRFFGGQRNFQRNILKRIKRKEI
jgi:hypothetical protein